MYLIEVSLLTGGDDKPYVFGLARVLIKNSISLEMVGGDGLDTPEWHSTPGVRFINLRRKLNNPANFAIKLSRILASYGRLVRYAWDARPKVFHILWNYKFEFIDRTLLMLYYK